MWESQTFKRLPPMTKEVNMFHKIKFVAYVPDYKLSVQFAEGVTKIYKQII